MQPSQGDTRPFFAPGFMLHILLTILSLGIVYETMRKDVDASLEQSRMNGLEAKAANEQIITLRIEVGVIKEQLIEQAARYEKDMNTYIREPHR